VEGGYDGTFDDFFSDWTKGNIAFGSFLDHLLSFAEAFSKNDGRLLLLSYDDMANDIFGAVSSIVSFLDLNISDHRVKELLESFSFQSMRENIDKFQPRSVKWKNGFCFLRKGSSGDSESVITVEKRKLFKKCIIKEKYVERVTSLLHHNPTTLNKFLTLVSLD